VNPTAENIAKLIYDHAAANNLPVAEVTLWETETSFATYRPERGSRSSQVDPVPVNAASRLQSGQQASLHP